MSNTVIIPTAGLGSRMGNYTKNLNKALLLYKDKPVIGHIIEQFPKDTRFVIPVGYLAQQVKDFCQIAYSDRHIEFIDIDDWTSPKSGTGYSVLQCKSVINGPFWYVTCDTYFDQPILDKVRDRDCYFVKTVPEDVSALYTMFKIGKDLTIQDITFKQRQTSEWAAWTGLMYIQDWQRFFDDLTAHNGTEFIPIIRRGSDTIELDTWLDFGSAEQYTTALSKSQKFDFSKTDEVTYICNNRVVKWWLNADVAQKKFQKTKANPSVFPNRCEYVGNYMAYDFHPGQTLYSFNHPVAFTDYLTWLKTEVWQPVEMDLRGACEEFYKTKTLGRIEKFLKKYPNLSEIKTVNGAEVKDYKYYLDKIDWDYLSTTYAAGFTHGDLHFDNTIIGPRGDFKVIDWRHEFADVVEYGDIYYDLAKLMGGFVINYANIKEHNFNIEVDGDAVTLSVPHVDHYDVYMRRLKKFIEDNGYEYRKVQTLVPIIFWNMSPLHTAPFDLFLWYLGIKLFAELDNEYSN
jgi:CTP:phosphocholine cytidylyltransferase-like protein